MLTQDLLRSRELLCLTCARPAWFAQPPDPDAAGDDEWLCVDCGAALFVAPATVVRHRRAGRMHRRRAA